MPDVTGHTPFKKFNFCHISPQNSCPKVLGIIRIFFGKCETSLCVFFFFVSSGFCLGTFPWMPFFPSLFLIIESWTLILIEASEACSSLDVILGSCMTSWISRCCTVEIILVGRPLLGRFTTVPSFLHLCIMARTVVHWSPKPQKWLYNPFQIDTSTTLFLICSWISLDIGMMCCFWDLYACFTLSDRFYLSDFLIQQVWYEWNIHCTDCLVLRNAHLALFWVSNETSRHAQTILSLWI